MAFWKYFCKSSSSGFEEETEPCTLQADTVQLYKLSEGEPQRKKPHLTPGEKKKQYKSQLSYKQDWEKTYPWVVCSDPKEGMFCSICQKWGTPPPGKLLLVLTCLHT